MIPRHQPAYTWRQWQIALADRRPLPILEAELEARICQRLGRKHAIFYHRGRDAFFAWFSTIAPRRPAIVPAFTCCVVPEAIRNAGNPLTYADIDKATLNMEVDNLMSAPMIRNSVVVMTHQFGLPCRADEIMQYAHDHNAAVFEDCAGALGASYAGRPCGSFGDVAVVSFENTKLLGSGSLGVLLTNEDDVAARLREEQQRMRISHISVSRETAFLKVINSNALYRPIFKIWSWQKGDYFGDHGVQQQFRHAHYQRCPDPFAIALALAQWSDIDRRIAHRRELMSIYREHLGEEITCTINGDAIESPIRQPVRTSNKRALFEALFNRGIDLGWSFGYTTTPDDRARDFPNASSLAMQILNLPIHEGVTRKDARRISALAAKSLGR